MCVDIEIDAQAGRWQGESPGMGQDLEIVEDRGEDMHGGMFKHWERDVYLAAGGKAGGF